MRRWLEENFAEAVVGFIAACVVVAALLAAAPAFPAEIPPIVVADGFEFDSTGVDGFSRPATSYGAVGVDFDGTNDYLTRGADFTGSADGKQGSFSVWVRPVTGMTLAASIVENVNARVTFIVLNTNLFRVFAKNAANTTILNMSATTAVNFDEWNHIFARWDLATAGSGEIYLNGTEGSTDTTFTDDTIDYTRTNWSVGANTTGGQKWQCCIADLYFNPTTNSPAVTDFRTAGGKPVDLGADGSGPTGTAPILFHSGLLSTWETNDGSGGGLTETGEITACTDNP